MNAISSEGLKKDLQTLPVIVLCGGMATRMSEITGGEIPKQLLPLQGKTILHAALKPFELQERIILATGVHGDQIEAYGADELADLPLTFSRDPLPNGVVGALTRVLKEEAIQDSFIITNGDEVVSNLSIEDMYVFHKEHGADITVAASTHVRVRDFAFTLDEDDKASRLRRTPEIKDDFTATNFGIGTFIFEQSIVPVLNASEDFNAFLHTIVEQRRLHVYSRELEFHNFNRPEDYEAVNRLAIG